MDFKISDRDELLGKTVREFAESEIGPSTDKIEETGKVDPHIWEKMGRMGMMGAITPKEYGGTDLGYVAQAIIVKELARVCPGIAMGLQSHGVAVAVLRDFGTNEQKTKYLMPISKGEVLGCIAVTEPSGGSDLIGIQTSAQEVQDGYILNGRKCYITNTHLSDSVLVAARTGEGARGLSIFVVEQNNPGLKIGREENKIGLRGANTGEFALRNCKIPREALIGGEGTGMKMAIRAIAETGRTGIASVALGIMEKSIEMAVKFANERILYGKPLSNLQTIQWSLAEMYAELEKSRWLVQQRIALQGCYAVLSKIGKRVSTGQAYEVYASICSREQVRPLTQRRFSDIIGFLDLYGLINARVISKGRYGSTRDISGSLNGEVVRQLLEGKI